MWMTLISRDTSPPFHSSLPSSISCGCPRHTLISSLHQLPLPSLHRSPLIASLPDVLGISALRSSLEGLETERFLPTALPHSLQRDSRSNHWPREQAWGGASEVGTLGSSSCSPHDVERTIGQLGNPVSAGGKHGDVINMFTYIGLGPQLSIWMLQQGQV